MYKKQFPLPNITVSKNNLEIINFNQQKNKLYKILLETDINKDQLEFIVNIDDEEYFKVYLSYRLQRFHEIFIDNNIDFRNEQYARFLRKRDSVINLLLDNDVSKVHIDELRNVRSVKKIRKYINTNVNNFQDQVALILDGKLNVDTKEEIDIIEEIELEEEFREYNDETVNSIKPIYTPMGNKR